MVNEQVVVLFIEQLDCRSFPIVPTTIDVVLLLTCRLKLVDPAKWIEYGGDVNTT